MIAAGNTAQQPKCAVEGCKNPGTPRFFPHYMLNLCHQDWIRALVATYGRGVPA